MNNSKNNFLKKNIVEIIVLISSIVLCLCFINSEENFFLKIEKVCATATILFTVVIIVRHIRKRIWNQLSDKYFIWFLIFYALALLIIFIAIPEFILAANIPDRRIILLAYVIITLFYIGINYIMTKQKPYKNYIKSINSYKNLLKYSDYPILSTFFILLIISTIIYYNQLSDNSFYVYESFFSGAAAFQMFFSNIVWLIIDE